MSIYSAKENDGKQWFDSFESSFSSPYRHVKYDAPSWRGKERHFRIFHYISGSPFWLVDSCTQSWSQWFRQGNSPEPRSWCVSLSELAEYRVEWPADSAVRASVLTPRVGHSNLQCVLECLSLSGGMFAKFWSIYEFFELRFHVVHSQFCGRKVLIGIILFD